MIMILEMNRIQYVKEQKMENDIKQVTLVLSLVLRDT